MMYRPMQNSVTAIEMMAALRSSAPTCGPTISRFTSWTFGSILPSAAWNSGRICSAVCPVGCSPIATLRELPR
jgi:hypothetical protein